MCEPWLRCVSVLYSRTRLFEIQRGCDETHTPHSGFLAIPLIVGCDLRGHTMDGWMIDRPIGCFRSSSFIVSCGSKCKCREGQIMQGRFVQAHQERAGGCHKQAASLNILTLLLKALSAILIVRLVVKNSARLLMQLVSESRRATWKGVRTILGLHNSLL